jgi:HEPN domain-containing protein
VEIICFHSQSAVEKALKAVLAYYEDKIPKIHDITALLTLCKEHTDKIHLDKGIADTITDFAVVTRYVEDGCDFTEDTAEFALKQAKLILEMVKKYIEETENKAQIPVVEKASSKPQE